MQSISEQRFQKEILKHFRELSKLKKLSSQNNKGKGLASFNPKKEKINFWKFEDNKKLAKNEKIKQHY